ncbi:MAG TPA: DUF1684 domain-containing protein [Acidimicrobiia bacterium]|nr:DUF1684 domain-containing protein [Acidimicrobiia bacterium]
MDGTWDQWALDLWDYRRQVHEMYRQVRRDGPGAGTRDAWVHARDLLFAGHPQSPIEDGGEFDGLSYFPYDPDWRTMGTFVPTEGADATLGHSAEGSTRFLEIGEIEFDVSGHHATLEVLWLDVYGGGIFLPFRDATNGANTYGGGRYLLDTVKGADLGHEGDQIVLDFNYSYHPSCVYSERWSCPLAPAANRLPFAVEAGERLSP